MARTIGIAGGGIVGRLVAFEAMARGWKVALFDKGLPTGETTAGYVAAGLLDPVGTLEDAEGFVGALGESSLERLPAILARLPGRVPFGRDGSLAVAHPSDRAEADLLVDHIRGRDSTAQILSLPRERLHELEPELDPRFQVGLLFPTEGWVHTRAFLGALAQAISEGGGETHWKTSVTAVGAHGISTEFGERQFDCVVDCRGLGARPPLPVRGVRGELALIRAPEVHLKRPIRLLHPRHPIYVIPREPGLYAIGATCVETEDMRPMTVRGALELLSAAFALHSAFAEGEVEELLSHCRPALPDNVPRVISREGCLFVNGLYRHGFLCSPAIAVAVMDRIETGRPPAEWALLFQEET